jgi:hypothetical protein
MPSVCKLVKQRSERDAKIQPGMTVAVMVANNGKKIANIPRITVSGSPPPPNARLDRHDVAHIRDVESHIWLTI